MKLLLIFAAALLAASPLAAGEVHCQRTAVDVSCSDGTRAYRNAVGETTISRPVERPKRCARTAVGVACRDD